MTSNLFDRIGVSLARQREQYSDVTNLCVYLNDAAIADLIADARIIQQKPMVSRDDLLAMTLFGANLAHWADNRCPTWNFKIGLK